MHAASPDGRADLQRWLIDTLLTVGRDGPGGTSVFLDGPPGIGKTHLVAAALAAQPESTRVLRARGDRRLRNEPFAAVELLAGPDFIRTAGPDPVEAAFEAVDAICAAGRLVVAVDDAQHLDGASLTVLRRLVWASRSLPLGVVVAGRSFPERDAAAQLARQVAFRRTVPAMTSMDVELLVAQQSGRRPSPALTQALEVAGGNPLFVREVLNTLQHAGALVPTAPDRWDLRTAAVPPLTGLNSLILAAVHELDEPTRDTLAALAVWGGGSGVRVADLSATLYSDDDLVAEQLERAAGSGLVRRAVGEEPTDRVARFRHELYREVVYADIDDARRRALHGRVGALLRDRLGPGSSVVADHLLQAARPDQPADPAVLSALRDAVRRSAELAPAVAADLLADADSFADLGAGSEEMLRQRAQHLFVAGRGRETEQLVSARIGAVRDPAIAAELQVILLRSLVNRAETGPALEIIDRILARPTTRPATRHWAEAQREWLLLMLGFDRSAGFDEALARYRAAGDDVTQAAQLSTIALFSHLSGDTDRALDLARQRHALVGDLAAVQARSTAAVWPAVFHLARNGPAAGLAAVAAARQQNSTHDSRWIEPFLGTVAGSALMLAGDWDGAVAEFTTGLQLAEEVSAGWVSAAVGYRSYIDAHRGATASARERLDTFRHSGRPLLYGQDVPGLAELAILEADGQTGAAATLARTLWAQARDGFPRWTFELAPEVLRVALIGLDRRLADAVNRDVLSLRVAQGAEAIPLLIGGAYAADPERLTAAVDALTDAGRTMIATVATEELAYAWAVAGNRKRAADRLNEAVAGFERMGALPDRDRALARCRQLGIRAGTRGRARTGVRGWAGLTETENRIALLVRDGLTNPEIGGRLFISPRTVQTHVSHIMTKTGVRSRVEIASAMQAAGAGEV